MKDEAGAPGSFAGLSLATPRVMGIINVTPDSFSDGGEALHADDAIGRGRQMLADGADILDVGG
jgi:dihydropteroate synthase